MRKRIMAFIRNWFTIKPPKEIPFHFNAFSKTIPEAFGYPEPQFQSLVHDLTAFIDSNERLISLDIYLKSQLFEKHQLNLNDPSQAAVFGYAFAAAIFIQREAMQHTVAEQALQNFYPIADPLTVKQKVVN